MLKAIDLRYSHSKPLFGMIGIGSKEDLAPIIRMYCEETGAALEDISFLEASEEEVERERHNGGLADASQLNNDWEVENPLPDSNPGSWGKLSSLFKGLVRK